MENKYASYRRIRYERTNRPLGKMTLWRVLLGIALLLLALLISGVPSQRLAAGGHYKAARALMIAPGWMERYKPADKAFIEAGALLQAGDAPGAAETLLTLEKEQISADLKPYVLEVGGELLERLENCGPEQKNAPELAEALATLLKSLETADSQA